MHMTNENRETNSEEKKVDKPVFERRLKDVRVVCWRNETQEGRVWFHATVGRTYRKGDAVHEAPGSLNGLPDIALAIAGLEAVKKFIEQQPGA
jgi:hypothetical protein